MRKVFLLICILATINITIKADTFSVVMEVVGKGLSDLFYVAFGDPIKNVAKRGGKNFLEALCREVILPKQRVNLNYTNILGKTNNIKFSMYRDEELNSNHRFRIVFCIPSTNPLKTYKREIKGIGTSQIVFFSVGQWETYQVSIFEDIQHNPHSISIEIARLAVTKYLD